MRHWIRALLLVVTGSLFFPSYTAALSCSAAPVLSPVRMNLITVDATVVRRFNNDETHPDYISSMELAVSKVFQGELSGDSVVVDVGHRISLPPAAHGFPTGSRWLISFSQYSDQTRNPVVVPCTRHLPIVDDQIEGFIRKYDCPDHTRSCKQSIETMTIDEYDEIQQHYFAGVRQGVRHCVDNNISNCPETKARLVLESNSLILPYIGIYNLHTDLTNGGAKPPIMELDVRAILVEGENGILSFEVTRVEAVD